MTDRTEMTAREKIELMLEDETLLLEDLEQQAASLAKRIERWKDKVRFLHEELEREKAKESEPSLGRDELTSE